MGMASTEQPSLFAVLGGDEIRGDEPGVAVAVLLDGAQSIWTQLQLNLAAMGLPRLQMRRQALGCRRRPLAPPPPSAAAASARCRRRRANRTKINHGRKGPKNQELAWGG